jgi:dynactin 1
MAVQEKAVDMFAELLRKDQLDDNVTTENLQQFIAYFNTIYPVLLGGETKMNKTHLLGDIGRALSSACDSIRTDAVVIRALIQAGQETGNMGLLSQYVANATDVLQQQLKQIRLRIPQEGSATQLGFPDNVTTTIQQCCQNAVKVMRTLHDIVKASLQQIALGGGRKYIESKFEVPLGSNSFEHQTEAI